MSEWRGVSDAGNAYLNLLHKAGLVESLDIVMMTMCLTLRHPEYVRGLLYGQSSSAMDEVLDDFVSKHPIEVIQ